MSRPKRASHAMMGVWLDMPLGLVAALLAMGWLIHAFRTERRLGALSRELAATARSMDAAFRDLPRHYGNRYVSHDDLSRLLSREIDSLTSKRAVDDAIAGMEPVQVEVAASNIVPIAPSPCLEEAPDDAGRTGDEAIGRKLAAAIASDRLEVSLQPIVSISRGESVAFDIFAHLQQEGGTRQDIRRIKPVKSLDGAHFEQAMMLAAVDTARRRLGIMSERMKLHVAASEALLTHREAISDICEILRIHPGIARSIVLSLPGSLQDRAELFEPARELFDAGLTLALECDDVLPREAAGMPPIGMVKMKADNLLAMATACGSADEPRLPAPLATTCGTALIASDVSSDAQAMQLIDLGVDLMGGVWFSSPRRLGQDSEPGQNART